MNKIFEEKFRTYIDNNYKRISGCAIAHNGFAYEQGVKDAIDFVCEWMRENLEDDFNDCSDVYIEGSLEKHIKELREETGV